jgi:hypothetical protein
MLRPIRSAGCSDYDETGKPFLVSLQEVVAHLFDDRAFGETAASWKSYDRYPGCRPRAAAGKAQFILGENLG